MTIRGHHLVWILVSFIGVRISATKEASGRSTLQPWVLVSDDARNIEIYLLVNMAMENLPFVDDLLSHQRHQSLRYRML